MGFSARNKDDQKKDKTQLIQPDGGWGWMVVVGISLTNISLMPAMQSFGLIFKDKMTSLGINATELSFILNMSMAITTCLGIANGPILKTITFRKYSFLGAFFGSLGICLLSVANTFPIFLLSFSVFYALGFGMAGSSGHLALNSYFKEKRGIATGLNWTAIGIGPIIVPHLVTVLLDVYGVNGTALIFGGFALHTFVGAALLQPVEWHMKTVPVDPEIGPSVKRKSVQFELTRRTSTDAQSDGNCLPNGDGTADPLLKESSEKCEDNLKECGDGEKYGASMRKGSLSSNIWASINSLNSVVSACEHINAVAVQTNKVPEAEKVSEPWTAKRVASAIVSFFDLDLLKDPIYVNIVIGICLSFFAEVNFSILTPFVLLDYGWDKSDVATFMSVIAIADLVMRFLAPFVSDRYKLTPRPLYMAGITGITIGRTMFTCTTNYSIMIAASVWIGLSKGLRTVYYQLIMPTHVPLNKLAAANGLNSFINGIVYISAGSAFGMLREGREDYTLVMHTISALTLSCVVLWTIELFITRRRKKTLEH